MKKNLTSTIFGDIVTSVTIKLTFPVRLTILKNCR